MSVTTQWNPETYAHHARFVSELGAPLLQLLDPQSGEVVLDLGCGDGALTEQIAAAGCLVVGADSSWDQIRATKRRGLNAILMDGERAALLERFDAVFSNAALHWMRRAEAVIDGVSGCLKPGGRFVGEFGGTGNVETIRAALHRALRRRAIDPWQVDPWYYPSTDEYAGLLRAHAFQVAYIELIPRPTQLPGDMLGWLEVFAQPFTSAVSAADRAAFLQEVRERLAPALQQAAGDWHVDYVRLRFKAIKQN
jgi:trans-aconitate methyltransferase